MKKKNRLRRSDVVWGFAVAALVVLQFWWLPGEKGTSSDSYSNTIDGKLGLYRTLKQLFPNVSRDNIRIVPEETSSILMLVAPDRYPTAPEERELYQYVYNGGQLLFAPNWSSGECQLASLGIDVDTRFFTHTTSVAPGNSGGAAAGSTPSESPTELPGQEDATPAPESSVDTGTTNEGHSESLNSQISAELPDAATDSLTDSPSAVESDESAEQQVAAMPSLPSQNKADAKRSTNGTGEILERRRRSETGLSPPSGDDNIPFAETDNDREDLNPPTELEASSVLTTGTTNWRTRGTLNLPQRFSPRSLVTADDSVEVAYWPLGMGGVMVSSSPDVFSNRSLLFEDSRRLAIRMVEYLHAQKATNNSPAGNTADVPVVINEFLNASDSYRQTGVLFSPALRVGTLQLIVLAVLGLWYGFHRFGPAEITANLQRRSLTDSALATGNLLYRLNDGGAVVKGYLEYLSSQLRRRYGNAVRLDHYEALAARTGLSAEDIKHHLKEAERISKSAAVPTARAAASVKWLAELQSQLTGNDKRRNGKT